jgi:predicted RNase H-like nuclease (RuvC/YqgF family)
MSYPNGYAGMKLSPTLFQDLMKQQNEELDAKDAKAKEAREYEDAHLKKLREAVGTYKRGDFALREKNPLLKPVVNSRQNNEPLVSQPLTRSDYLQKGIDETDKRINALDTSIDESAKRNMETEKKIAEIAKVSNNTGGYKKVKDKYTVKELKAIASRNNIKITKKLNGKTVPLNKKGLFAKLKRNKVI